MFQHPETAATEAEGAFVRRFVHNRDLTVAIVDSDLANCEALSLLFRLEGYATQFETSLDDLENALSRTSPDVIVTSMEMIHGPDLATIVRHLKSPQRDVARCVIVTARTGHDIPEVVDVMRAGAAAVVPRPIDKEALLRLVAAELGRKVHRQVDSDGQAHVTVTGFNQLTPREREVVTHIVNAHSNKEIARDLHISPRTVEVHRSSAMHKLGAKNTADLVTIVLTS